MRRPTSAPSSRASFGSSRDSGFIHRDIFAPPLPPGGLALGGALSPVPSASSCSSSSASAVSAEPSSFATAGSPFTTPAKAPQHHRNASEASIIPSAKKIEAWNNQLGKYPLLGWLESHTGIRKVYLAVAMLLAASLLVFRGVGSELVTVVVGFLYPLHMSLKTIENCTGLFDEIRENVVGDDGRPRHSASEVRAKRLEIIASLRTWLIYWLVYGLFACVEAWFDFSLGWMPVYYPLKLAFLLWTFLPSYQGSQIVFDILVRPVLVRHQNAIQDSVDTAQKAAMFSMGRVGRVVRAKSIQLTQAIQKSGGQLLSSQSGSMSSASGASSFAGSGVEGQVVRPRVAAIESMSSMGVSSAAMSPVREGAEGEHFVPDEDVAVDNTFEVASRLSAQQHR